jgi:beta-N-acetylhexosaminidase
MTMIAAILGCAGPTLSDAERTFFRDADPLGFILFQRNCQAPDQVRTLVDDLRDAVGRADARVLIDQEGGRVARLKAPAWRAVPAAGRFGELARRGRAEAVEAVRLNAELLGRELADLGITVDCAPVLDLRLPGQNDAVVGDRAFGDDPELVAELGRAACEGFLAGGILPVIKHMPGHGRATVDSHHALPRVDASLEELRRTDFRPFRLLRDMPVGISAHVVYTAIDPDQPATTSHMVIERIIRGEIGFAGLLVSDDLSMQALSGSLADRTRRALAAGCDIALHCNGRLAEMEEVVAAATPLSAAARERIGRAQALLARPQTFDLAGARARLDALLAIG